MSFYLRGRVWIIFMKSIKFISISKMIINCGGVGLCGDIYNNLNFFGSLIFSLVKWWVLCIVWSRKKNELELEKEIENGWVYLC